MNKLIYRSDDEKSKYVFHNPKLTPKAIQRRRFAVRYGVPTVLFIIAFVLIFGLGMYFTYNFATEQIDIVKLFILTPILCFTFGFIAYKLSYAWLRFISECERRKVGNTSNGTIYWQDR